MSDFTNKIGEIFIEFDLENKKLFDEIVSLKDTNPYLARNYFPLFIIQCSVLSNNITRRVQTMAYLFKVVPEGGKDVH